jgi:signal transduction histidine kinase/DNA-binding response OmpR family regulator
LLGHEVRTLTVLIGYAVVFNLLLLRADLPPEGMPLSWEGLPQRLAFIVLSLIVLCAIRRAANPVAVDRWSWFWIVIWCALSVLLSFNAPYHTGQLLFDLSVVVALYALPAKTIPARILPPLLLSLCHLVLDMGGGQPPDGSVTVVAAFIAANVAGWLVAGSPQAARHCCFPSSEHSRLSGERERSGGDVPAAEGAWEEIVDAFPAMLVVVDNQRRITRVNRAFIERMGGTRERVVGSSCCELLCRRAPTSSNCPHCALCVAPDPCTVAPVFAALGPEVRIETAPLCDSAGRQAATVLFLTDISARKQTGQALQTVQEGGLAEMNTAREAAEAASKAKSDFLALVSHEIRTSLSALVGFSGLARKTADIGQLHHYVDCLDQSAHLLMDLVNDVLDMSKVEARCLVIDAIPFNLPETLDLLHGQFSSVAAQKDQVEFTLLRDDQLPLWILGDPTRFRQILSNLLSNALKFTESGSVILTAGIEMAERKTGKGCLLVLEVRDTGIGIDADKQALLFQPFQQLKPCITRKYGGTGLGLTIVRRLVELMGGRIKVASRPGQGSCFTVELPCVPCAPPHDEQLQPPAFGALSILVVEDNAFNRVFLQETLHEWGHRVTTVHGAVEALGLMTTHRYDCIILDVWMPDVDGLELARRLRRLEDLSDAAFTPIIAYTADTDARTRQRCRAVGIQAVLYKPLDPRQLARAINAHCGVTRPVPDQAEGNDKQAMGLCRLDQQILEDMEHDPKRIATYAKLLRADMNKELNHLEQALLVEDRLRIREVGHSLKGLCGYLHDRRGEALALRVYREATELSCSQLEHLVQELRRVCIPSPDLPDPADTNQ